MTIPRPSRDLENSRPLNVSLCSTHWAFDELVQQINEQYFDGSESKAIKRCLSVILVNLLSAWKDDPTLCIALKMSNSGYKPKSRYNPLAISNKTIFVVKHLIEAGSLGSAVGFYNHKIKSGRLTRIWAAPLLVERFKSLGLHSIDVTTATGAETIILRNTHGDLVEYEDTDKTNLMRSVLDDYNLSLKDTFIDIPTLGAPVVDLKGGAKLHVNQHDKFVRRVYNRESWDKGGRFFGGWWQRCPKKWRQKIFIDDQPTIEDDYSGLHIVMLYGWKNIDYWDTVAPNDDPYQIEVPSFLESAEICRSYAKTLMLMAINADDNKSAFQAFRQRMNDTGDKLGASLKNTQLSAMLELLRAKHTPIAEYFGAGAGIDLMNQDARITEYIIKAFLKAGRPILTVHDSYIVTMGDDGLLRKVLQEAFSVITGIKNINLKREGVGFHQALSDTSKEGRQAQHLHSLLDTSRSLAYIMRQEEFYSTE